MNHDYGRRGAAAVLALFLVALVALPASAQQPAAARDQVRARILIHYMAWYEAKPYGRAWGWHWTMNAFDPDGKKAGKPQIASHYHPLIGPYDSADPDVLEYHALLMKLAGADGVIIDWYGRQDLFDYAIIDRNASAMADHAAQAGLALAVCYEDQTVPQLVERGKIAATERVSHARTEIGWLRSNWFTRPSYLKLAGKPVLLSFGRGGLTDDEWAQALAGGADNLVYLSEHERRPAAAGAFDWPVPQSGIKAQEVFYKNAPQWPAAMASAFPRFHDIYAEAKVHESWGAIEDDDGKTFRATLEHALQSGLPLVQIATWNDWGEGTVIEPSVEFGYRDLETVQRLRRRFIEPGFAGQREDLRLPYRLFKLRKAISKAAPRDRELDAVARLLIDRSIEGARAKLGALETNE